MAQTIRRKATGVRRQARAHDTKRQVRQAKQTTSSLMDWLMRKLPFTEEQLQHFQMRLAEQLVQQRWFLWAYNDDRRRPRTAAAVPTTGDRRLSRTEEAPAPVTTRSESNQR